ncbi:FAD-dependent oxidoreductase [Acinetobacter modestus]|uniref:NAD(P)/FAD-dependent oxidoreductase n=1 Tax=Acinetobacter modestus TaxID=1776740 RepID=UPI001F4A3081|nr:FAD-dependent oxidoreductase [Acinetobacter modestus]MCH7388232.1 FAD-dependent oxidoreductase [Acinetobacter modestus]
MKNSIVIIGTGHAAAQLAVSLRQQKFQGEITMIGNEPYLPYHRPPLSKAFLSNEKTIDELMIRTPEFYHKHQINIMCHRNVVQIDRIQQTVKLDDGQQITYDQLAICTGARVRKLSVEGHQLSGVFYIKTIDDVIHLKKHMCTAQRAVVIGGGYIGLEAAAVLKHHGLAVTVFEAEERILKRVTAPELSEFYTRIHYEEGVCIHVHKSVEKLVGTNGAVKQVVCQDGTIFDTDLVIVGIGVLPNIELAQQAGLKVEQGICIDAYGQTSDQRIVAAGDCVQYFSQQYQRSVRVESIPNANDQAKIAASTLCGDTKTFDSLPWFWSDQYDLKLQIAGLNNGYDQVYVRGDLAVGRSIAIFYYKQNRMIAADCINRPQEFMLSKRVISSRIIIDPVILTDENISINDLINNINKVS